MSDGFFTGEPVSPLPGGMVRDLEFRREKLGRFPPARGDGPMKDGQFVPFPKFPPCPGDGPFARHVSV